VTDTAHGAFERANDLLERYGETVRAELPLDVELFDAHTHLGTDIDGMIGDRDELLAIQAAYGITRSFMFCLDEPDRHPSFSAANDRTLAHAAASGGRLVPFVRLDLNDCYFGQVRTAMYKNIERFLARRSDRIVAISEKQKSSGCGQST